MITFDETKRLANIAKHGIDLAALSGFFEGDLLPAMMCVKPMASCASRALAGAREKCCSLSGRRATTMASHYFGAKGGKK